MSSRYQDDPEYRRGEPRHPPRRETRERDRPERVAPPRERERRIPGERIDHDTRMTEAVDSRMDTRLDTRIDSRMDSRMDNRMDLRPDQRPSTTSRIDPRPERMVDPRGTEPEVFLLRDPTTGEFYREVPRNPSARSPYAREDRDYDAPSRNRTTMDVPITRERDPVTASKEKSFNTKSANILVRMPLAAQPGTMKYAAPVDVHDVVALMLIWTWQAMEQSLRQETVKWQRERERRARQGRSQGMANTERQTSRSKDPVGSYAEMQARQESQHRYAGEMDIDDDDYGRPPPRHRELEARPLASGRVAIPVTSTYAPEPGFPAQYTISSGQPGYPPGQSGFHGSEREPRTFPGESATAPSISRSGQLPGGYAPPLYPTRTGPPISSSLSGSYDPRRDVMGAPYGPGYSDSRRHGR
ncbi:hypothetical protein A1O1_07543 [Capronia coronata CBS 617.96]|uniref:Uncharacterized protein n=1 Tax=Capronia coronata CBS 617.96 TaxID=1182541 RepID=W9YNT3_9EURO|nr:uncharacterized protein A1O1_07543 [Capronia coronata CBS 617.96]EXJ83914.1 hypothetical protein A1O1_07543 [Capronia coronata CBS 617.96]